jgi:hypothetical protein
MIFLSNEKGEIEKKKIYRFRLFGWQDISEIFQKRVGRSAMWRLVTAPAAAPPAAAALKSGSGIRDKHPGSATQVMAGEKQICRLNKRFRLTKVTQIFKPKIIAYYRFSLSQ